MKKALLAVTFCSIFLLHLSSRKSFDGSDKPDMNIQGTIIDSGKNSTPGKYITIGGSYERICFYLPSLEKDKAPTHRVYIDLKNIKKITVAQTGKQEPMIHIFGGGKYVEVMILTNDQTPTMHQYIIEKDKIVRFEAVGSHGTIHHEVPLSTLHEIVITEAISRYIPAPSDN